MAFKTFLLSMALVRSSIAGYVLEDDYSPSNFFSMFDFFTDADPTNGFVKYVDQSTADSCQLISTTGNSVYMGVDHTNVQTTARPSVRITSKKSYNEGLVVLDLDHMPGSVCGTWPAFWMVGSDWPNNGEIDIIEGVNDQTANSMALHTGPSCQIASTGSMSGTVKTDNCCVEAEGQDTNEGCSIGTSSTNNYGDGFNSNGGGVYATLWTNSSISIYFFPKGSVPSDLSSGSPDPSNVASWGLPQAVFSGSCDISSNFKNLQIVFDTTFCGDWAGNTFSTGSCASKASSCTDFVANNPSAFNESYWSINSLKVYQYSGSTAVSSSAAPVTPSSSAVQPIYPSVVPSSVPVEPSSSSSDEAVPSPTEVVPSPSLTNQPGHSHRPFPGRPSRTDVARPNAIMTEADVDSESTSSGIESVFATLPPAFTLETAISISAAPTVSGPSSGDGIDVPQPTGTGIPFPPPPYPGNATSNHTGRPVFPSPSGFINSTTPFLPINDTDSSEPEVPCHPPISAAAAASGFRTVIVTEYYTVTPVPITISPSPTNATDVSADLPIEPTETLSDAAAAAAEITDFHTTTVVVSETSSPTSLQSGEFPSLSQPGGIIHPVHRHAVWRGHQHRRRVVPRRAVAAAAAALRDSEH